MNDKPLTDSRIRIRSLSADDEHKIELVPDAATRAAIATELGIPAVRKLRLQGTLIPQGRADWRLEAVLGATVVQDCVVTLAPVTTRLDVPVVRVYLADPPPVPEAEEVEMPDDDSVEALPSVLDLGVVMIEALALALPDYPHAEGVTPQVHSYTAPGEAPMTEAETKPFAGLAALRDKLTGDDET